MANLKQVVAITIDFIGKFLLWSVVTVVVGLSIVLSFVVPPFGLILLIGVLYKVGPRVADWARRNK